jgi:hypothetical protein
MFPPSSTARLNRVVLRDRRFLTLFLQLSALATLSSPPLFTTTAPSPHGFFTPQRTGLRCVSARKKANRTAPSSSSRRPTSVSQMEFSKRKPSAVELQWLHHNFENLRSGVLNTLLPEYKESSILLAKHPDSSSSDAEDELSEKRAAAWSAFGSSYIAHVVHFESTEKRDAFRFYFRLTKGTDPRMPSRWAVLGSHPEPECFVGVSVEGGVKGIDGSIFGKEAKMIWGERVVLL